MRVAMASFGCSRCQGLDRDWFPPLRNLLYTLTLYDLYRGLFQGTKYGWWLLGSDPTCTQFTTCVRAFLRAAGNYDINHLYSSYIT